MMTFDLLGTLQWISPLISTPPFTLALLYQPEFTSCAWVYTSQVVVANGGNLASPRLDDSNLENERKMDQASELKGIGEQLRGRGVC